MSDPHCCPSCTDVALDDGGCAQCGGKLVPEAELGDSIRAALAQARVVEGGEQRLCPRCGEPMALRALFCMLERRYQ